MSVAPASTRRVTIGVALAIVALCGLNLVLLAAGVETGVPAHAPLGEFWPKVRPLGPLFAAAYVAGGLWALGRVRTPAALWLFTLGALVVGNLVQGDPTTAFIEPFTRGKAQYFHDALRVGDDWAGWLARFVDDQHTLGVHARTHPPGAVLLHLALITPDGGAALLAITFTLIASAAPPLLALTARALDVEPARALGLGALLAVVPAFGIYGAASLDAVVLTLALLALLGAARLARSGVSAGAIALVASGLIAASALTFAALYLWALAAGGAIVLAAQRDRERRGALALGVAVALALAALVALAANVGGGFDWLASLARASALENPDGLRLVADPIDYGMTRLEGVAELLFFLSLPVAGATLAHGRRHALARAAAGLFCLMLLTGAFRTGETARACLFVVPLALLPLAHLEPHALRSLARGALVQGALMQLAGSYFW